jgi:hypothetical protein
VKPGEPLLRIIAAQENLHTYDTYKFVHHPTKHFLSLQACEIVFKQVAMVWQVVLTPHRQSWYGSWDWGWKCKGVAGEELYASGENGVGED